MKPWIVSLILIVVAPPSFAEEPTPLPDADGSSFHLLFLPGVRAMDSNKWQISVSDGSGDASRQTVMGGEFDIALADWPAHILIGGSWSQSAKNSWGRSENTGSVEGTVWEGYLGARKYFGKRSFQPYVNGAVTAITSRLTGKGYTTSETTEIGVMGGGGLLMTFGPFVMGIDGRTVIANDVGTYGQFTGVVGVRF